MKKTIRILIFAIVISAVSGFGTVGLSNDTFFKYGEKVLIKFKQPAGARYNECNRANKNIQTNKKYKTNTNK